jgi:rRNA-processing protein FCF1
MYSEENKSSTLAKFLSIYDYVFVDTCSLMEDGFPSFMDTLSASKEYWKEGLRVIVPGECVAELKKHSRSKDNQEARIEAKRALKILHHDKWHGKTLEIAKPIGENDFADNALYTLVSSLRIQNKILIITQDKTLTTDLKHLNNLDSQHGRYLDVYRLKDDGSLEMNPGESAEHIRENAGRRSASQNYDSRRSRFSHDDKRSTFHHYEKSATPRYEEHKERDEVKDVKPVFHPEIVASDERLFGNLNNPNYPTNKRLADIDAQLKLLSALPKSDLDKLELACTYDELKSLHQKLAGSSYSNEPVAAKVEAKPVIKEETKPVSKPVVAPLKVEERKEVHAEAPKGWFEFGRDIVDGAIKCGTHYGILFRDPSIPYFKEAHGPYDITSDDIKNAASKVTLTKVGDSADIPLGPISLHAEKTERDYKVWLILAKPSTPKVEVAKEYSKPVSEDKIPAKKDIIPAKVAPEAKKPVENKVHRVVRKRETKVVAPKAPKKANHAKTLSTNTGDNKVVEKVTSKVVASPDSSTAVPVGASLIVGVPSDEGRRSYIERRSRRLDNVELETAKPTGEQKANRHANHVSKKNPSHSQGEIHEDKSRSQKKETNSANLEKVQAAEKRLNANLGNPNYPTKNRIRDLKAQDAMINSLTNEEKQKLKYNHAVITSKLAELEKSK